jgi:plasmid stabilization system protein ParE
VKVSISSAAEAELVQAAADYAQQASVKLGVAFLAEVERSVQLLRTQPKLGALWQTVFRRLPLRRFPYSIVYQLHPEEIRVHAIAHQRRKPGYWIKRH